MAMPLYPPNVNIPAAEGNPAPLGKMFVQWLKLFLLEAHRGLAPPKTVIMCNLSASDIANYFDDTGKGVVGTAYQWWAICNGSNDTPDLVTDNPFIRHSSTASGGTGGSVTSGAPSGTTEVAAGAGSTVASSAHTHDTSAPYYELVFLMRIET